MALSQAMKESLWIQRLLNKLGRTAVDSNIIYTDNHTCQNSITYFYT